MGDKEIGVFRRWNVMDLRPNETEVYDLVIFRDKKTGKFFFAKVKESLTELWKKPIAMKVLMDTTVMGNERLAIEAEGYVDRLTKVGCAVKKIV